MIMFMMLVFHCGDYDDGDDEDSDKNGDDEVMVMI